MTGTERKVFQKYYPPDFDPSKLPKAKGKRNRQFVQRVMVPFNMQCNTCHEYIYKGKKFNMRRETADGENYLGLKIFRFYFRCPNCIADISFKTDLENCDYIQEHGATRLFDAFKFYNEQAKQEDAELEAEKNDPMKMLEKRTQMSKQEMQAMGELEEIQELNRRNEKIDARDFILDDKKKAFLLAEMQRQQEEEDEEFVRQAFNKIQSGGKTIKRIEDDEDELSSRGNLLFPKKPKNSGEKDLVETLLCGQAKQISDPTSSTVTNSQQSNPTKDRLKGLIIRKRKPETEDPKASNSSDIPGPSRTQDQRLSDVPGPSKINDQKPPNIPGPDRTQDPGPSSSSTLSKPPPSKPNVSNPSSGPPAKQKLLSSLAAYGSDSD